jgi:hypothetical protein
VKKGLRSILLVCGFAICGCFRGEAQSDLKPIVTSVCALLQRPTSFENKSLEVVVRIEATKEGAFIWSSGCPKLGVTLLTILDEAQSGGILALRDELARERCASATLKGVYLPDHLDEIRHRKYPVFQAVSATDILPCSRMKPTKRSKD